MEKSEFIQQFQDLNTLIEIAILSQDFDKVTRIDESRRKLLKEFAAYNEPSEDKVFFEGITKNNAKRKRCVFQWVSSRSNTD